MHSATAERACSVRSARRSIRVDPPIVNSLIAGAGLPNTYPTYDLLGRRMFFGVSARFQARGEPASPEQAGPALHVNYSV